MFNPEQDTMHPGFVRRSLFHWRAAKPCSSGARPAPASQQTIPTAYPSSIQFFTQYLTDINTSAAGRAEWSVRFGLGSVTATARSLVRITGKTEIGLTECSDKPQGEGPMELRQFSMYV